MFKIEMSMTFFESKTNLICDLARSMNAPSKNGTSLKPEQKQE